MIDIRARNFENAAAPAAGPALKSVTYTVRVTYNEVKSTMAKTKRAERPKMGRPSKIENVVRKSRGVRIHPDLLKAVDDAVSNGYIDGVSNFSEAVEKALTRLIQFKPKKATA